MNKQQKTELIKAFNLFVTIFNKWLEKQATCDEWQEEKHKRDKNGRFAKNGGNNSATLSETDKEIEEKIDAVNNTNFNKTNYFPALNKSTIKQYGFKEKKIRLKKDIIDRNKNEHADISDEDAIRIFANTLYKPETVLKANKDKPSYHHFITRTDDRHNDLLLLDLSETEEYYDIVHYFVVRNRSRNKLEKLDKKIKENKS